MLTNVCDVLQLECTEIVQRFHELSHVDTQIQSFYQLESCQSALKAVIIPLQINLRQSYRCVIEMVRHLDRLLLRRFCSAHSIVKQNWVHETRRVMFQNI